MNAVGVIPARWGAKRLPGKSLVSIGGKPLLQWVIEGALGSGSLDRLLVATDDTRIADLATSLGVEAVMTRPDHPSGTDRCAEAVAELDVEVVVNIQGDELLLPSGLVDTLVQALAGGGDWDMATAAARIHGAGDVLNPSVVKVVWAEDGRALYFSRSVIPHVRDEDSGGGHWRHIGVYAYRKSFLQRLVATQPCASEKAEKLEQLRALHIGGRILVLETEHEGIGIDTPEDVFYAETKVRELGSRISNQCKRD